MINVIEQFEVRGYVTAMMFFVCMAANHRARMYS